MTGIDGVCRDVCEATEFVTIVTMGDDGPHVVGNWGDYMRVLGIKDNTIVFPAGRYQQTEKNLRKNNRVQLLVASKKVPGNSQPRPRVPYRRHWRDTQFRRNRECGKGKIPLGARRNGDPRRGCQNSIIVTGYTPYIS